MNPRIALCLPLLVPVATPLAATDAAPNDAYAAVGSKFARDNRLHELGWSEDQVEAFISGIRATFQGSPRQLSPAAEALMQEIGRRVQELEQQALRQQFGSEAFARPGYLERYLKDMRSRLGLQASDSGLVFGIKVNSSGARPEPGDTVIISYKVNTADGQTELPGLAQDRMRVKVQDLLPGLAEGLQMMTVGSGALLVLPPDLSYGSGEWPAGAERGTPLIFTVALHEIVTPP